MLVADNKTMYKKSAITLLCLANMQTENAYDWDQDTRSIHFLKDIMSVNVVIIFKSTDLMEKYLIVHQL